MAVESGRRLTGELRGTLSSKTKKTAAKAKDVVDAAIGEVLITGCRDTQTSADAYIAGDFNGALTYHLVKAMGKAKGKITCRDLHAETLALLKKGKYDQVPQLEGRAANLDRAFLAPVE